MSIDTTDMIFYPSDWVNPDGRIANLGYLKSDHSATVLVITHQDGQQTSLTIKSVSDSYKTARQILVDDGFEHRMF